jgi:hypothetical protein
MQPVYQFISLWVLELLLYLFFAIMKNIAMTIHVQEFV